MCAELESTPHRSFSLRMKSTLTSRGKSVNINASIYRVSDVLYHSDNGVSPVNIQSFVQFVDTINPKMFSLSKRTVIGQ